MTTAAVELRDLLFDDPGRAAEAMTTAVLGRPGGDMGDIVRAMPGTAREAALARIVDAAAGVLERDVTAVFCDGWRKHSEIRAAARESRDDPDRKQRSVALATHSISLSHEPAVQLRLGGRTLATIELRIRLELLITGLKAVVRDGLLIAVEAGSCDAEGSLAISGVPVASRPMHLPLPLSLRLGKGWPLLNDDRS